MVSRSCTYLRSVCSSSVTTWQPGYSCELDANSSAGSESLESLGDHSVGEAGMSSDRCSSRNDAMVDWQ